MEPMFSIIIPVHNHPEFLLPCIRSIKIKTRSPYRITVVDDGSDDETVACLWKMRSEGLIDCLLRNDTAMGFSFACNRGLKAMESDYYCLLNSDTEIGTEGWNKKIIGAADRHNDVGLISVISNSAINQSIPTPGPLLPGFTPDTFAGLIEQLTESRHPLIALVHGFCYVIKKSVIESIGFLDEKKYPDYGSEDDYTFRAAKEGFRGMLMDDVFVYHYNNGSYQNKRKAIVGQTVKKFNDEWGRDNVMKAVEDVCSKTNYLRKKVLDYARLNITKYLFIFLAHTETGKAHYLGEDGFPITPADFKFFEGTEEEAKKEAQKRVVKFASLFSVKVLKTEYQKHPLVDTGTQAILKKAMIKYVRQMNDGSVKVEINAQK